MLGFVVCMVFVVEIAGHSFVRPTCFNLLFAMRVVDPPMDRIDRGK